MTAARPAAASGVGRRRHRSARSHTHGSHAQTDIIGHAMPVMDHRLKPNTRPVSSAPPARIPSSRPNR